MSDYFKLYRKAYEHYYNDNFLKCIISDFNIFCDNKHTNQKYIKIILREEKLKRILNE